MYCSEQIVIPEKVSNLLKTYAKGKEYKKKSSKNSARLTNSTFIYITLELSFTTLSYLQNEKLKIHQTKSAAAQRHTKTVFIVGTMWNVHHPPQSRLCENLHTSEKKKVLQLSSGYTREIEGDDKMFVCEKNLWEPQELHRHMSKIKEHRDTEFQTIHDIATLRD